MKPLKVDFASPPAWPRHAMWALAAALAVVAAFEGWRAWELQARLRESRAALAEIEQRQARAAQRERDAQAARAIPPAHARDAAVVAQLARFPLPRVLQALEATLLPGIKLLSLDLSALDGAVRAEIEFADHETLLRYLERLNDGEPAPRWRLQQARTSGAFGPGQATLVSGWNDTGAADR